MGKFYLTFAVAAFILALGPSQMVDSQEVNPQRLDRYDPAAFDVPETVAGYRILAFLTKDNFRCMKPGEKRLIVQVPELTIERGPSDFPSESIKHELEALNLDQYAGSKLNIVDPDASREQIVSQLKQSHLSSKSQRCPQLQVPGWKPNEERKYPAGHAGYAIIQNDSIKTYTNNNGQSVVLVAPPVPNNQAQILSPQCTNPVVAIKRLMEGGLTTQWVSCQLFIGGYSAFLNNGLTDRDYFMQVGLNLSGSEGQVVWAAAYISDEEHDLAAKQFSPPIKYVAGHRYYTTIAYTSGLWWTCAADLGDTKTYQCAEHEKGEKAGEHLKEDPQATSVFAENWNLRAIYSVADGGTPVQWIAENAQIYVAGQPHNWVYNKPSKLYTLDGCKDAWTPDHAISGDLTGGKPAYFNALLLPPFCQ